MGRHIQIIADGEIEGVGNLVECDLCHPLGCGVLVKEIENISAISNQDSSS